MQNFIHENPTKVYFGENQFENLGKEISKYGNRVLLTYGGGSIKKSGLYDVIMKEMKSSNLEVFEFSGIEPNPRIESVREGARICKENNIDVLLAVGGGSTIDATKFMASGACVEHDPWLFFTGDAPAPSKALPLFTILTLAATGSEMNAGGVISNLTTNEKLACFSPVMQPKVSFLDPSVTYTVSSYQTACGSADIMSHIMEVYFNTDNTMFMLDTFMEGMLKTVIKYAPIALADPTNYEARANLMWASTWAINGFVGSDKTHDWTCHPIEHELSAFYDITHGLGLAIITPRWMEYCLDDTRLSKFYQFGVNVFGIDSTLPQMEVAKKAIEMLKDFFFKTLKLDSTLTAINIDSTKFDIMAKKACGAAGSLAGFKTLFPDDVKKILEMSLVN